jgi:flavin prenyltransferase
MRLVIGISGASGVIYGVRLLEVLRGQGIETHLVLSDPARDTLRLETPYTPQEVEGLATHVYPVQAIGAAIASGSFKTDGMAVAPCSIKSLAAIAHSFNDNLLVRAADVTLKERRCLVLMVRETPLHQGHLRAMLQASQMGAVILPPVPAFYHHPQTVEDIVDHSVGKLLDLFGIAHDLFRPWKGIKNRE